MFRNQTRVRSANLPFRPLLFPTRGGTLRCAGYAGVEILLGLAVVLLFGWVVVRVGINFQHRHRCQVLAADLRAFAQVLESAPPAPVDAPRAVEPGQLPAALEAQLAGTAWSQGSPFGGRYEWIAPSAPGSAAAIAVTAFAPQAPLTATRRDLERVDRLLDDGNLATGRFRAGFNGWPLFQLASR